ncbi:MAG: rhodanese-related sulfurtransferase [Pyrinomonadaceae bacterium]
MANDRIQIISFYEFKPLEQVAPLGSIRADLRQIFSSTGVRGTVIIAAEGYNGMVCGKAEQISQFVQEANTVLDTVLPTKVSFHEKPPFRKIDVKIKPEIVTLKKQVDLSLGKGTHVPPKEWNEVISYPETVVLDARNDYEYRTGTFQEAINPDIPKFSDLPRFVDENLDPRKHKRVAMFCTGGIRCEKFAPYMKQIGFEEVYQLEGGILRYLEEMSPDEMLWEGECFVFDERITVDKRLQRGSGVDHSQRHTNRKKPAFKTSE